MEIQTNTDHSIVTTEALTSHVSAVVTDTMQRFGEQITRVVVHLSQGKDSKSPDGDHRCVMEAHVKGHAPVVANGHANNLHQAIQGAADKLKRATDSVIGRMSNGAKGGSRIVDALVADPTVETEEDTTDEHASAPAAAPNADNAGRN